MLLAVGCGRTEPKETAAAAVLSQDRFPGTMANAAEDMSHRRPALYAPVTVRGEGRFADGLPERISPRLADGWHGMLLVEDDCIEDDCLHWVLASDDGEQQVELLPVMAVEDGALAERDAEARVPVHLESMRLQRFPGSRVVSLAPEEAHDYGVSHRHMLTLAYRENGREMTAVIRAWLQSMDVEAAEGQSAVRMWTRLFTAPAGSFGEYALSRVADSARLSNEGHDAWLMDCLGSAMLIRQQQYIGSDSDSLEAQARCRHQDAMRSYRMERTVLPGGDASTSP